MTPPKRPTPLADPFEYATEGHIHTKADLKRQLVAVEIHKCTAYLSMAETVLVVLQIMGAGWQVWGMRFIREIQQYMEHFYQEEIS